jgi:hypothetical protein
MRGRLWVVVLLPLGAGVGFLSLETIGILLIPIILVLVVRVGRRVGNLPEALMSFGVGFLASVSFFAIRTSGISSGTTDFLGTAWFVFWLALGVAMVVVGWVMRLRRLPPHEA